MGTRNLVVHHPSLNNYHVVTEEGSSFPYRFSNLFSQHLVAFVVRMHSVQEKIIYLFAGLSVVVTVPGGTELAVVGRASDGVWYYVEGHFGRGWVNSQYVLFRGDNGSVPVVSGSGN